MNVAARSQALLVAAGACGLLWVVALVIAAGAGDRVELVWLGAAGLAASFVLLWLVRSQGSRIGDLAGDPLTGLINHRGFHQVLDRELAAARERGVPVALVLFDLDNFRAVNDAHGHPLGDRVLRAVGSELRAAVRATDTPARVGGEEFALILPGAGSSGAFAIAERARATIAGISFDAAEISCSAGIAAFPNDAEDGPGLYQLANSALYWAKRDGKGRTRRFDPEHSTAIWTDRQRDEIVELLELDDPITCVFQPMVSLATGRVVGYEALARFPVDSLRTPDVWFAQAHGCGLGAELEAAAIEAAMHPLGRPLDAMLSINVSPSALSSPVVQRRLRGNLEGLVIEVTEHEFVPDDDALSACVADLRERGARIAIDDAGAGHAGLKQLMRVRPDIVKLDRALVSEIHTDPARMALVESFVRFARDVGATVCAEGIESLQELEVIADLDVQWGQGWVLARPSAPWTEVSAEAAELCRAALAETFRSPPAERHPLGSSDRRLVHVSARLASARNGRDLENALAMIAAELGASEVVLSALHADEGVLETLAENGESTTEQVLFALDDYPLSARSLREQEAVQIIVGDPDADPSEVELLLSYGKRSLLMVPVVSRGESLGIIEAYRNDERPWTRAETNRARVIANQFASVIPALSPAPHREASF